MITMRYNVDRAFWKRRFWDGRMGYPLVGACLNGGNFIILSYNFTGIEKLLPIELYAPLFIICSATLLVGVGHMYRNIQQRTEYDRIFERQPEQAKTLRLILEMALKEKNLSEDEKNEVNERLRYLKNIEDGK